jgi:enoyl-CoA hydratase
VSVLEIEADGPVRIVTINRPDELNAVDRDLHRGFATIWRELAADQDARAVVLTGAGGERPAARDESLREGAEIIDELLRFPLPVVAAVNGPAVGLGCSIALLCDVVLISESAYLCDPHVSVGLVAGDGGAAFWPLLAPILRVREYLFTGDRIPAAKAVELGLASRTCEPDQLLAEATALAQRMAAQPAAALQGTKRVVNMALAQALAGPVQAGFAAEQVTMQSEDHRRRLEALRKPR